MDADTLRRLALDVALIAVGMVVLWVGIGVAGSPTVDPAPLAPAVYVHPEEVAP